MKIKYIVSKVENVWKERNPHRFSWEFKYDKNALHLLQYIFAIVFSVSNI